MNEELNMNVQTFENFTRTIILFISYLRVEWKAFLITFAFQELTSIKRYIMHPGRKPKMLLLRKYRICNYSNKCLCLTLTLLQIKKKTRIQGLHNSWKYTVHSVLCICKLMLGDPEPSA